MCIRDSDIDAVDKYAKIVTDLYVRGIERYNGEGYLYQMWPTYSTDRDFTTMGRYVGATPDGRRAGEPISENQSPSEGSDINGITAMLNSVSKIPFDRITGEMCIRDSYQQAPPPGQIQIWCPDSDLLISFLPYPVWVGCGWQ